MKPNAFTYSALIEAYGRKGLVTNAESAFGTMKKQGILPNVVAYNALLKVFVTAGRLNDAFDHVDEMERGGKKPDVITFGTLIDACSKARDVER